MPVERCWGELLVSGEPDLAPILAVASAVDSTHRMTREERDLRGVAIQGSDHLTAYNIYAEAVNRFGVVGEVHGLERHGFEEGIAEWADERGVLVKAIEDAAMGMASVYRSLELKLPRGLPYVSKELKSQFVDLVARVMPFDLVIDERTADGQEARVGKRSFAGNWGAVAGSVRFFADRFGVPRASVEGTTISYDQVRQYAKRGEPRVTVSGSRKHQRLLVCHTLSYFGFALETLEAPLPDPIPDAFLPAAMNALIDGVIDGSINHPDQGKIRRAARELDEYWRRSGGALISASQERVRRVVAAQLDGVASWSDFMKRRLELDPADHIELGQRVALDQLPATVRLFGDTTAIEYDIDRGQGVIRLRLRDGQARRMTEDDVPAFDRPVRFQVLRGEDSPIEAETLAMLKGLLRGSATRHSALGARQQQQQQRHQRSRRRR